VKKVNEVRPKLERSHSIRFEAPRAIKQAKPLTDRNAKPQASRKFR
jgi:hypothetical protein